MVSRGVDDFVVWWKEERRQRGSAKWGFDLPAQVSGLKLRLLPVQLIQVASGTARLSCGRVWLFVKEGATSSRVGQ